MELAVAVRIASEFTGRVQLSVFPYLLERLIQTRRESSVQLPIISRLIRMDPALCFMAMRLDRSMSLNSQAMGPFGVDDVVSRIGMAGIDAITTQAMVDQALHEVHHRQGLALVWLWQHCLTTALLAQGLALAINFRSVEEAYISGLLHDIGKMALFARTPAACVPMLADPDQAKPLLEAEAQVAGSGHDRIGAQLIRRYTGLWFAADSARYHAAAATKVVNALPLVQIVWAANRLASGPHPSSRTDQRVSTLLNLAPQLLDRLSKTAKEQALEVINELCVVPHMPEKSRHTDECTVPLSQEIKASTVLSSVYRELLTATDRSAIIRVLQQSLSIFLGINALILFDHEPQSDLLVGRFAAGSDLPCPADRLRIPLTAKDCLPAICHISGEAVDSFSQVRREKLTIIDQQLRTYMHKDGFICVPVRSGIGGSRACLLLGINASDWPWVKRQTTLLAAIVAAVAGVLEREQRHDNQRNNQVADSVASTVLKTRKIVHEINNPLSIIKNYLKVLTLRTDENPTGKDELHIINEEINRVTGLLKSLTSTSEKSPIHLETVDVNSTITEILSLFRESLPGKSTVRLNQDLDENIPFITSDRDRLKQALINLLKNAMEALPDGGIIGVSTRMLPPHSRQVDTQGETGQIKISVCDDGPGIDEGIRNDLFKPNVTSKSGHDGLGLSIVHEAVKHIKGSLLCESAPGRGTCFHIKLPIGDNGSENGPTLDSST